MNTCRFARAARWPTNSDRLSGRMLDSVSSATFSGLRSGLAAGFSGSGSGFRVSVLGFLMDPSRDRRP
ncbi:hypothetical protein MET9862_05307 [Methylobacterium symbioticum]|uniref:Uncharacterized protein n=1 Tax=Methylobacterium symbioticum TaxID=2584084 RepID=A0A509ELV6_9HYPH|nr:hypothetical protein MET9862_05307 [Methylobacterium symbioticum]